MDVQKLKSYFFRNAWMILLIVIVSWLISMPAPRPTHILFFIIFVYIFMHRLQQHEYKVRELYQFYTDAVYKEVKVKSDLIKFLNELQTIGLVISAKKIILEKLHSLSNSNTASLEKLLYGINMSINTEKSLEILKECETVISSLSLSSDVVSSLLEDTKKIEELAEVGYRRIKKNIQIKSDFIIETLVNDNKKITIPLFGEIYHDVQSTINLFLVKRELDVAEAGMMLENLKLQILKIVEEEVVQTKERVEEYLVREVKKSVKEEA